MFLMLPGVESGITSLRKHNLLWERACSRKRCASHPKCWLTRLLREQARSHKKIAISSARVRSLIDFLVERFKHIDKLDISTDYPTNAIN